MYFDEGVYRGYPLTPVMGQREDLVIERLRRIPVQNQTIDALPEGGSHLRQVKPIGRHLDLLAHLRRTRRFDAVDDVSMEKRFATGELEQVWLQNRSEQSQVLCQL